MFEQASRLKLRFNPEKGGQWMVEDLWDASLAALDRIAIGLHNTLKETVVSFVDESKKPDARTQLKFEIVNHIIKAKKAENTKANEARAVAEKKQKILAIMAQQDDAALKAMSAEELRALYNNLA